MSGEIVKKSDMDELKSEIKEEPQQTAKTETAGENDNPAQQNQEPGQGDSQAQNAQESGDSDRQDKPRDSIQKRFNSLTRAAKEAKENENALRAELEELKQRYEDLQKQKNASQNSSDGSFASTIASADSPEKLAEIEEKIKAERDWAFQGLETEDDVNFNGRIISKSELGAYLRDLDKVLSVDIAKKKRDFEEEKEFRNKFDAELASLEKDFAWFKNPESAMRKLFDEKIAPFKKLKNSSIKDAVAELPRLLAYAMEGLDLQNLRKKYKDMPQQPEPKKPSIAAPNSSGESQKSALPDSGALSREQFAQELKKSLTIQ